MITTREQLEQAIESEVERNEEDNSDHLNGWAHCVTESDLSYFEDQVQKVMDSYEPRDGYFSDIDLKASDVVREICKNGSWEMIARSWMTNLDREGLVPMWSQEIGEHYITVPKSELSPTLQHYLKTEKGRVEFYADESCDEYFTFPWATDCMIHAVVTRDYIAEKILECANDSWKTALPEPIEIDGYKFEVLSTMYMDWGLSIESTSEDKAFYNPSCLSVESYGFHDTEDQTVDPKIFPWTTQEWIESIKSESDVLIEAYQLD